jgi:hypothetical protein
MIVPRSLFLAGLPCLLAACGGERTMDDAASDLQPGETPRPDTVAAAAASGSAEPGVPAFVTDSAAAAGPASASDSSTTSSVYTSLAEADCRLVKQDEETGATSSRCPGTAGHALLVHDYDARMTVDVVAPGGRTHRLRYSGVITSAFSSLGPRAEWRMRNGRPIALIVRVNAFEDPANPNRATSYLAVAKITSREACVTDRIPPAAGANEAAWQAADQSASRPCMRDLGDGG